MKGHPRINGQLEPPQIILLGYGSKPLTLLPMLCLRHALTPPYLHKLECGMLIAAALHQGAVKKSCKKSRHLAFETLKTASASAEHPSDNAQLASKNEQEPQ